MRLFPGELYAAAEALLRDFGELDLRLATVESCTGGLLTGLLTEVPGSSRVIDRGFVTYSNEAKIDLVGVDPVVLMAHGAVSRQVAIAMAEGALDHSEADVAIAITGVAGPDGGSDAKPVGLVHLAAVRRGGEAQAIEQRYGPIGRQAIRLAAVTDALQLMRTQLQSS